MQAGICTNKIPSLFTATVTHSDLFVCFLMLCICQVRLLNRFLNLKLHVLLEKCLLSGRCEFIEGIKLKYSPYIP